MRIAELNQGISTMLIKLLFKSPEPVRDDVKALIDASVSLGLRMDKITQFYDVGQLGGMDRLAA